MSDETRDLVHEFKRRLERLENQVSEIDRNVCEILRIVRRQEED